MSTPIENSTEGAHKFTDTKGDEWVVSLAVSTIKEVRSELDIDFLDLDDGRLITRLISDPITLVDVLFVICRSQAERKNITDHDFGKRMAGDVIAMATEAMLEALVSFIPNPRDRANMSKVLAKTREVMEAARDQVDAEIEGGALERIVAEAAGKSSTNSPA